MNPELLNLITAAEEHARRLAEDIPLSRTRAEHIRVTARANEAQHIANLLTDFLPATDGEAASAE